LSGKKRLVIILGPTAVGKSDLALRLAQQFEGEIINCDSRQVYRGFDIGTDKPTLAMRQAIAHHLVDIVEPQEQFTAAAFVEKALKAIQEIISRGHLPLVVGGTGLYLKALTEGLFPGPGRNPELRRQLEEEGRLKGLAFLHERLQQVDPNYGRLVHPHDRVRIIRALEIYELTGQPPSANFQKTRPYLEDFQVLKIGLKLDKNELHRRIEARVERMFERGIINEVSQLLASGVPETAPPFQALGYRQVRRFLRGEISEEEAKELTKKETKLYAKRQMTWFRKMKEINWFEPSEYEKIIAYLQTKWPDL